ncbi:UNKNOWN [Stylonychia lemnae]|uniref:J domain-containing protein n=1 Tax=Stylonychia lemnae TaxID=5949 RepID=A0A078BD97_STYLE|nr:UNKNOWN [Stylonychia lemnae]|eukprot:CDW91177.1 UNKNOWN [Stylonychia lemnae]
MDRVIIIKSNNKLIIKFWNCKQQKLKFLKVKEAYEVLSNQQSKLTYDNLIGNTFGQEYYDFEEPKQSQNDKAYNEQRELEFERIRQKIISRTEIEKELKRRENLEKEKQIELKRQEDNKKREEMRKQALEQQKEQWQQMKEIFDNYQQDDMQYLKHQQAQNRLFEMNYIERHLQQEQSNENQRQIEELYLQDYQNRIRFQERHKKEYEKLRKWNSLIKDIETKTEKQNSKQINQTESTIIVGAIIGLIVVAFLSYPLLISNKDGKQQSSNNKSEDYSKMRTQVLIPYEAAKSDPVWLVKKHANQKLTPLETEMYLNFIRDQELKLFWSGKKWDGLPSPYMIAQIIQRYHQAKSFCMTSFLSCSLDYNREVYFGIQDECGSINPFQIWHEAFNERRSIPIVQQFMDQYEIPLFQNIGNSRESINAFFQAKYGMFTCIDSTYNVGQIDFDPELVIFWERQRKNTKFIWYLSMLYAIRCGKVTEKQLEPFKKDLKQTKRYLKYIKNNPKHQDNLVTQMIYESAPQMMEKMNNDKRVLERTPRELEHLVVLLDDDQLNEEVIKYVEKQLAAQKLS